MNRFWFFDIIRFVKAKGIKNVGQVDKTRKSAGGGGNAKLHRARAVKNDEFYTQLSDIEKELNHYTEYFAGKTVYCNCDDPYESNFFKYFVLNFNRLKLKKLIATCYKHSPISNKELSLFPNEPIKTTSVAHKIIVTEVVDENGDGAFNLPDIKLWLARHPQYLKKLKGDGDFRSDECVELLKQADIVVTNPPFSLFREYIAQLVQYDKKFVVIGNKNAVTFKEVFPLIKDNKVWLGYRNINQDMWLIIPNEDAKYEKIENGKRLKHIMACWYTNLDHKKRHEELILYRNYTPKAYSKYDNYDAINVNKVDEIPMDYDGVMGVPITFIDKYNPAQFEIVGLDRYTVPKEFLVGGRVAINGKPTYARILIKRKQEN